MICYVYTGGGCISAVLGELVGELASPPEAQEGLGTRDEMVSIDSPQKALHPGIYIPSMYLYKVCFDWRYMRDDGKKLTLRYFSDVFFFFRTHQRFSLTGLSWERRCYLGCFRMSGQSPPSSPRR